MKAQKLIPSGIPKGHVGPLYPAENVLTTFNHGTNSRTFFIDDIDRKGRPTRKAWMELALYKEDRR